MAVARKLDSEPGVIWLSSTNLIPSDEALVFDKLRTLGFVTKNEWQCAIANQSAPNGLSRILEAIALLPAPWSTSDSPQPRLTEYQRELILAGQFEKLMTGDYVILDRLGGGGMGDVFKAWDAPNRRLAAIKVLNSQSMSRHTDGGSVAQRFQREIAMLKALQHPGICSFYGAGEHNEQPFLAMELLNGQDFQSIIRESIDVGYRPDVDAVLEFSQQSFMAIPDAGKDQIVTAAQSSYDSTNPHKRIVVVAVSSYSDIRSREVTVLHQAALPVAGAVLIVVSVTCFFGWLLTLSTHIDVLPHS